MQWLFIGALVALNVAAWVVSVRSGILERKQLVVQQILVWLLPLFGAILVLVFALSQGSRRRVGASQDHAEWENANAGDWDNADVHHSHSSEH